MVKSKEVYVGDLGECKFGKGKNSLDAYFVLEEDGTKSWQLIVQRSDTILKEAKVIPIEPIE